MHRATVTFDTNEPNPDWMRECLIKAGVVGHDAVVTIRRDVTPVGVGHQVISETRVTDPDTGGEKGEKLAQLGALDPTSLMEVAKVAGYGCKKYARYNFLKGYRWSLSYDALQRHLHAFWGGENIDPESGLPHLAHACWHCLTLLSFSRLHATKDDRPNGQVR
jgi:Domain of unknown function (DUF5664)